MMIVASAIRISPPMPWDKIYDANRTWPRASKAVVEYLNQRSNGPIIINTDRLSRSYDLRNDRVWFIVTDEFSPDSLSLTYLYSAIESGAHVCIIASDYSDEVSEKFGVAQSVCYDDEMFIYDEESSDEVVGAKSVVPHRTVYADTLEEEWTSFIECIDEDEFAVHRTIGAGSLIMSTINDAFTNHSLVHANLDEIINAFLERMPNGRIVWDQHYKPKQITETPMLGVLNEYPGLRAAYWLMVFGGCGVVIVNLKRRQRAIPVLPPIPNSAVDFVDQITMVYWNRRDHGAVARQLLRQFRLHLVQRYRIQGNQIVAMEADRISRLTGCDRNVIDHILQHMEALDNNTDLAEAELIELHKNLELFFSLSPP